MLEVVVSSAILATALMGAMTMTRRASAVMQEAARESQASQVVQQAIGTFLAHPFGTPIPSGVENITLGDIFRCKREWTLQTPLTEITHAPATLTYEILTVTVIYTLANGGERKIASMARRYQL